MYQPVVGRAAQSVGFRDLNRPETLPSGSTPNTYEIAYIVGNTAPARWKSFFPPGAVFFTASFSTYLSQMDAKAAMRFKTPPALPLSQVSYDLAFSVENSGSNSGGQFGGSFGEEILQKIQAGQELYFFGRAGGGLMPVSEGGPPLSPVPQEGGWVYGNFQYPDGVLAAAHWILNVDKGCYDSWYANAEWDANGNPVETATHTCAGSGTGTTPGGEPGGVPNPGGNPGGGTALSGIVVSHTELMVGSGQTSVMVGSVPDVATLPACSVSPQGILEKDELLSEVTLGRAQTWRLMPTANVGTSVTVIFNCGGRTASVRVLGSGGSPGGGSNPNPGGGTGTTPGGPTGEATVTSQVVSAHGQPVVVRAVLTRPASAVAAEGALSYWVGARIEAGSPGFARDAWFFLTPQGWMPMSSPNRAQVAYRTAVSATGSETLELGLGVQQEQAVPYRLQVFLGYAGADHVFRNMGVIWDPLR